MSRKPIEYLVLQGNAEELMRQVAKWLAQGWEPLGGIAVAANKPSIGRMDCTYVQAMVRYTTLSPPPVPPPLPPLEPTIACPQCSASISVQKIQKGANLCPECQQEFIAE